MKQLGVAAYLCGGTVRDLLLRRSFRDVDVVLSNRVFETTELLAARLNAPSFVMDEERQVTRVVFDSGSWDLSGFRNHTIEGDLAHRDFTINAIAIRWEDFYPGRNAHQVMDPFNGQSDLQAKIIRTVGPDSLREDPLRMLRAFRIHAELHFTIESEVLRQIEELHSEISRIAAERITEELDRIFEQPDSASCWQQIGRTTLFDSLFPEMAPMKGCSQGGYHHLDVWEHTVQALENFESLLQKLRNDFPQDANRLNEYLNSIAGTLDRKRLLKWVVLLHDIGKPATQELKEPGRWRFHGHDHAGSDLVQTLLKRLKFSRKDSQLISTMIEHHLRPLNLFHQGQFDKNDFYRFFRAAGSEAIGILLVSWADLTAARGPLADLSREPAFMQMIQSMIRYYFDEYYPATNTPELLRGRDLMAVLQMKPGPLMGKLLSDIREEQLSGALRNREEALAFANEWLKKNS